MKTGDGRVACFFSQIFPKPRTAAQRLAEMGPANTHGMNFASVVGKKSDTPSSLKKCAHDTLFLKEHPA